MDRSYVAENTSERNRLRTLVSKLSDEDLSRTLENGWTIAEALAHLAFWDQLTLALLRKWKRDGVSRLKSDADTINEALRRICKALPVRAAAQLAISAADEIDRELEGITPELAAEIETAGRVRALKRWMHRREHLNKIEQVLGA
jgi:hypothetical protein